MCSLKYSQPGMLKAVLQMGASCELTLLGEEGMGPHKPQRPCPGLWILFPWWRESHRRTSARQEGI